MFSAISIIETESTFRTGAYSLTPEILIVKSVLSVLPALSLAITSTKYELESSEVPPRGVS